MAHHNYLIGHNTSPDRNKTNPSRLTALTPQNQPERPLLRGNQPIGSLDPLPLVRGTASTLKAPSGIFMADLMGSIAVVISGVLTLVFDWDLVDPILSILIAALAGCGKTIL